MRLIESIAPVFFLLIVIEIGFVYFKKKDFYHFEDSIVDLSLGVISRIFDGFILLGIVFIYDFILENLSLKNFVPNLILSPNSVLHWILLFVLLDFLFYFAHRFSHEIKILWASHVVHHSSQEYNLTVALRQSFVRNIGIGIFYLPLATLGFPIESYLIVDALNRTYQFWVHTRFFDRLHPFFEFIMVTPSHHRVHHAMNPEYIDRNYGGVFIVWDRIFGTFQQEVVTPRYGLVTQLKNSNPIYANLHVFRDLFFDLYQTKNKWEGLLSFFSYPSIRPKDLLVTETNYNRSQIDSIQYRPCMKTTSGRVYLFLQWSILSIFALSFIKKIFLFNPMQIAAIVIIFVNCFYSLGVFINRKKILWNYELVKYSFLAVLIYVLYF